MTEPPPGAAPDALVLRWTRVSATHHRFEIRCGATISSRELETRSCLWHDLVHFAVETEARLTNSFYGSLLRGVPYEALTTGPLPDAGEIAVTERVVGALQGAWKQGLDPERFLAVFGAYQQSLGEVVPAWLTVEVLARVKERLRALEGAWRATRFGDTLELRFELA